MQNELMYSFRENNVRVLEKEGETWFVAKDICNILGLVKVDTALNRLKEFEKDTHTMGTLRGKQNMSIINESGLYSLIFTSRKEEAEDFRYWVTSEVLPSIRKRGIYATEDVTKQVLDNPQFMIDLLQSLQSEREEKAKLQLEKEVNKPKVLFAESVENSDSLILVRDLAIILRQNGVNIGQNRLYEVLRNEGYLVKGGTSRNLPTQRSVDLGLFRIVETTINRSNGSSINKTPKVTGKGQAYFVNKFLKELNK